jgi:putative addiction module CopG family antidote
MNVSIGDRWEGFVANAVKSGRYGSASEVVREGLRLVEEREARLRSLRDTVTASIAAGGHNTEDDLVRVLDEKEAELAKAGYWVRRLILLDSALADFASILEYIARESESRVIGRRFVNRLRDQCKKLASLPGTLGRSRPELQADLRSFAFKGYLIFFRYEADTFLVVNVLEGHRDITAYFRDDPD